VSLWDEYGGEGVDELRWILGEGDKVEILCGGEVVRSDVEFVHRSVDVVGAILGNLHLAHRLVEELVQTVDLCHIEVVWYLHGILIVQVIEDLIGELLRVGGLLLQLDDVKELREGHIFP